MASASTSTSAIPSRRSWKRCAAPAIRDWCRWPIAGAACCGSQGNFRRTSTPYLGDCHAAGQTRPTPLILKYEAGGYNCLHQDLYGERVFPLQMTGLLSAPERDFTGGEFLLVEQRPRAQSKGEAVPLEQGDAVLFAVRHRPAQGSAALIASPCSHGVSRIRTGQRYTLGVIFHDAE